MDRIEYKITWPDKAPIHVTRKGAWLILSRGTRLPKHIKVEKLTSKGWATVFEK